MLYYKSITGRTRRAGPNQRAGLSLIEVMIALALLSIALITLMSKVHGCMDTAHVTEYQNASRELAKGLMADVEAGLVEGLFNGAQGNFEDKGYPQISYVVGFGDTSSVGSNYITNGYDPSKKPFNNLTNPYDGVKNDDLDLTRDVDATDTDPSLSEEPFMRVRIVITFPSANPEKPGVFIYERMVPTECTQGTAGIQRKKEKDAEASASSDAAGAGSSGTGGAGNSKPNNTGAGGGSVTTGSLSGGGK
ncbi:MAG: type II secretion system protein [Planctomycetota bacterium]